MSILTDSRMEVTGALTGLGAKVYDYVPAVPVAPAIVCTPAETWVTPGRIGARLSIEVAWKVMIVVAPRKNDAATKDLEDLVAAVIDNLPAGYQLVRVGAPQVADLGAQGSVYTSEITITAQLKE